jgi:hypothetical protein
MVNQAMKGEVSMSMPQNPPTGLQSSRRNLIRMTALVVSALLVETTTTSAEAGDFLWFHWGHHHHHPNTDPNTGGNDFIVF